MVNKITEIHTDRLWLRQWRESDKEPFAILNGDPKVMEFFPSPLDRVASNAMADKYALRIEEQGWGFWAIEITDSHQFIGFVGLNQPTTLFSFSPCVEIGWRLAKEFWGNGYATEAASASLNFAFDQIGLKEVVSFTSNLNLRSQAVMRRIGMIRALPNFAHPNLPIDHRLSEHCLFRATADDLARCVQF